MKRWKNTKNIDMFWKTRIFYDSMTANGNKFRTYRNLKEKYETDTYLFIDIDKTLIKQFTQIKSIKIFSKFFINCVKKSLVRKSTLIIPNMEENEAYSKVF
jgi:hypothetical protein